ncbi:hypothetical protein LINPERPRIM_LOCUS30277 [Linum perenne]
MNYFETRGWHFRGAPLKVSKWFPEAGRSNFLELQDMCWVLVFGIPVHLRSEEIFRKIGSACGGMIDSRDTDFSAVRLKVKRSVSIPSSLFLEFEGTRFEIKVVEEPCFSISRVNEEQSRSMPAAMAAPESLRSVGVSATSWVAARVGRVEETKRDGLRFKPTRFNDDLMVGGPSTLSSGKEFSATVGPRLSIGPKVELIRALTLKPFGVQEREVNSISPTDFSFHAGLNEGCLFGLGAHSEPFGFISETEQAQETEKLGGEELALVGWTSQGDPEPLVILAEEEMSNSLEEGEVAEEEEISGVREKDIQSVTGVEVEGGNQESPEEDWETITEMGDDTRFDVIISLI